jgi:hypothetical protein
MRPAILALALFPIAGTADARPSVPYPEVILQGLDKVTARISEIEAPVGQESHFGSLAVVPRACFEAPPTETPESAAFLEIYETEAGADPELVFSGWMFASSPGLSALEHAVYDVWVIACAGQPDAGAVGGESSSGPGYPEVPDAPSTTQSPNG